MIFEPDVKTEYSTRYFIELIVITFCSYWAHFLSFRSYSLVSYSKLAPFAFTGILWNILFDITIFGKPPELFSLIGIVIILLSIYLSLREKMKEELK
jgi:drug/metabolite transporter (DMT)-like permease